MQTPTAPLSTLKSPPPKIPPMKKIPLQAPPNNNNGPNPLYTPQLPPPPPPPPAAKNFPSQQENSSITATNNSTYCTNASLLRSGRLLRLSAVANSSTTSTNENGAAGVGSPRDSSHHRTTSSFSLDKANNNNSSNSVAAAEAVIAALLSKQGAFSEALRLDKSRKPVATFEPMDQSKWVPDGVSSVCMSPVCEIPFSLFTRRHHCRSCGLIFCSACLKHTLTVSSTPDQQATPSTSTYRVCAVCFFIHQLAITQNFFSASANNNNNNKNKYVTTDHQHNGAHPFTECLTRSDLIKQVRYVSVDGGTSYRATTSNNNNSGSASSAPVGPQQTSQSNKTNNSTTTTIIISPSACASVVKNHQNNNNNSKNEDRVGDEAEEEEHAKSISPRQQPHHHHHEAENNDDVQKQQNHQHRQQPKRNQQPQAKPTYVSYWSSEQRLNAMQRRGKLRAFPWSILVSIAEFLPLINNADENESNNSITNFSKIDEADSLNESLNNDNASCMNDSGTTIIIRNSQFRKGGLFSFSLVCSDFYFAARANSVWNQWLNRLRTEGTWMIIPNDEILPAQRLQRQQSKNAKSKIDSKSKNSNNSAKERQDNNNNNNIVVDNLTMSATRKIGSNITNNIDGFEERTFSLNAFDATGLSPVVSDLVPNNSNSSQQDRTVNNNNNNAAASSSSATTTTTSAAGSFYFSPPFSVFAEFVTEAAFHRANQLSASGARLHKLFANGIRLTFAGDEEQLKNNLVRGFALGDLAFLNNNNSNNQQQQQQPLPTSSSANDLTFSPLAENTEYDAQASAPSFSSPTTRNNVILNQTSYPAPLPPPPPSMSNMNTNGTSGGRNNNINNGSLMNSSLFASSVLGFSTFNQLVHVALSGGGGGGSSNDFEHSQEIVGVRQSFVRMYNVKSGRRYWKIARLAARSSHAVVVCYDATSRDSLTHAALYFTEVVATSLNPKTTLRILCGVIPNNSSNNNNSNLISPETALAFVGCSASNLSIASLTVSASDPVGAVESIVQAVFSRTLRGDPTPSGPGVITSAATPTNGSAAVANGGVVGNNNQKEDILTVPTVLDILCSDGADLVQ